MREEVVDVVDVALVQEQGEDHLGTDTPKDGYVNLMKGPRGYGAGDGAQSLPASSTFPGDNHRHLVPSPANQVAWVQHTHTTLPPRTLRGNNTRRTTCCNACFFAILGDCDAGQLAIRGVILSAP